MPRPNPEARERLVAAAADMLRRRGLNATSVREVAKHAQAAFGSTYHYFPGGKQQMVAEAVQLTAAVIVRTLRIELAKGITPGLRAFLALWRNALVANDFRVGCPVLAVSVEEPQGEETLVLAAAADAFSNWEALLADALLAGSRSRREAESLATLIIASVEGAIVMARAKRSIEPFDRVAKELERLVGSQLD